MRAKEVVTQPHMPRGPRFSAPAIVRPKPKVVATEEPLVGMPPAVVADPSAWEAAAREPPRGPRERGLAFLIGASTDRFRPGSAVPSGFGPAEWGASLVEEDPATTAAGRLPAVGELTRRTAAAFREPLSLALGTGPLPPRSAPDVGPERPRPRAEWVTFEAGRAPPGSAPAGLSGGPRHA